MTWSGQFHCDLLGYLGLAAIWVAWRHAFSAGGVLLALAALFGGTMFLAPYLVWATTEAAGNPKVFLLGRSRVNW